MGRQATEFQTDGVAGRVFVLLQGPSSFFFAHVGRELQSRGARVIRVGFCPGDRIFWRKSSGEYRAYRDALDDFGGWVSQLIRDQGVTDLVMLGDGREPHEIAIESVTRTDRGVRIWIVEHGYLRPNLILIEPDAMGGGSKIPEFSGAPGDAENVQGSWPASFLRYAVFDVVYHLSNVVAAPFSYPRYRAHSGIHPFAEYGGWIRKLLKSPSRSAKRRRVEARLSKHDGPLFLLPLQLSHDMQLRKYGTGEEQPKIVERILTSFTANAPTDALLVVKVHPMDNHLTDWQEQVGKSDDRVVYLDGGNLDALLRRAAGVVTVNSTVGLSSLMAGVPTLALGKAVYRKAGLTSEQSIDEFWSRPEAPDPKRVAAFCRILKSRFHVSGAFDGPGAIEGARSVADWLEAPPSFNAAAVP